MFKIVSGFILAFWLLSGCSEQQTGNRKPQVLVSTGMIGHAVSYLLDGYADVEVLMGPGVDPHLYKASQGDMKRLGNAYLIVVNGLHLEGKMAETFESIARSKPVLAVGAGIPESALLPVAGSKNLYDPHIWLDVALWSTGIRETGKKLIQQFPEDSAVIRQRLNSYLDSLQAIDQWSRQTLALIPENQRILITSHDAFHYFGKSYNIQVKGLQGISTVSEYGLQDISNMVQYITEHKIKAVFVESSVPEQSIKAVIEGCQARKHQLVKGGTLYSDAVGPDGSYFSMIRHNVSIIQKALSSSKP